MTKTLLGVLIALGLNNYALAQSTTEDILNLLSTKKVLSANEVDSLRAESAFKQQNEVKDKYLFLDLEIRPRSEFRNGFRSLPNSSSIPGSFTSQRSRLSLNYKHDGILNAQLSLQDVRVWGQADPRTTAASIQLFEAYVEPYLSPNLSIRIGRQRLAFDNQRLFAENDWRPNANTHDALNIRYQIEKITSELALALNQNAENNYGTAYYYKDGIGTSFQRANYKYLGVNYLTYNLGNGFKLSAINALDAYQDTTTALIKGKRSYKSPEKSFVRITNGGRIEKELKDLYFTIAAYYQWGENSKGQTLKAYYFQPEVRYTVNKTTVRIGAEVFSGKSNTNTNNEDNSFVGLYGVAHRFNGSLEYFTQQPGDVASAGLVNPYLFITQKLTDKLSIRTDLHYFALQKSFVNPKTDLAIDKYLGVENDWVLSYKANSYIQFDWGFSYGKFSQSLEAIKNDGGSSAHIPVWSYLQLKVTPQILKAQFK